MATLFNTRIADTYQGLLKTLDTSIIGAGLSEISDGAGNATGISLSNLGDFQATGIISFGSLKDIGENITISKFVDAADGLINNDNDTTIPTSAAIIDYVATQITLEDLDFSGDGGTTGSIDLDSQVFSVLGTANEITTNGSGQTLTIGLPNSVTISGTLTATTFVGDLNGTINTATTATTQSSGDNSTKVATTAYVDSVVTAQDLDFAGTSGNGSVDLDSQTLTIQGTTNEITTAATGQVLTVGLPSSITTDLVGNVTGNLTGNTNGLHTGNVVGDVAGDVTGNVTGNVVGNTTGIHTGNVIGNVTGDLTGDVTGNVTGNLVGDVTGNLTGNTTGLHTGNVIGNVTGDLTGNADTATAWANARTITLTGEATGVTPSIDGTTNVSAALTLTNSAVIDKVLTGLQSPAGATISATDSMLVAFGKLQSQINGIAEGLQFQGSWNATTNTPTLTSSVGTQGHYYIVNVAGSTNLNGITDWEVGDWAIFSTTGVWQRLDQTGVQGTGTTGNLTKWATGSTISDSIVSESGTALTVTGSLNTTLGSNIAGDFSVNTNKFTVGSATGNVVASGQLQGNDLDIVTTSVLSGNVTMSADASVGGTLTTASPVINTGISGSAILDDDTFATANATTVATSESIKAYVDAQDQGSGTVGTIAKFATSTTFNNSVITQSSTDLFLGGETYIPSNQLIIGASNQNSGTERIELDGSGNHIGGGNVIISHNRNLDIGTDDANSFGIWTTNQQRFLISSGGTATFFKVIKANEGVSIVDPSAGSAGTPQFKTLLSYQYSTVNALSTIKGGNEASGTNGTYLKFYVNSKDAVNTPLNLLTLQSSFSNGTNANFDCDVYQKSTLLTTDGTTANYRWQTYNNASDDAYVINSRNVGDVFKIGYTTGQATFTPTGGSVVLDANGQIESIQNLDYITAGGRFTGKSSRGNLGEVRIGQTATGVDGGYIAFRTSPSGSTTPTERLRISSGGQVAIGNSNPETDWWTSSGGGYASLQIGQSSFLAAYKADDSVELSQNSYLSSAGVPKGITASVDGARLSLVDGAFVFQELTTAADKSQTGLNVLHIKPAYQGRVIQQQDYHWSFGVSKTYSSTFTMFTVECDVGNFAACIVTIAGTKRSPNSNDHVGIKQYSCYKTQNNNWVITEEMSAGSNNDITYSHGTTQINFISPFAGVSNYCNYSVKVMGAAREASTEEDLRVISFG